jgi:hypothetical protein
MNEEDKSLDFTGIGKVAKAIPAKSWNRLVKTACDTFSQLIAPITSTTYGLGRLIQAKFNGMTDVQKIFAADAVNRARQKTEKANTPLKDNPKAIIILQALENASNETDDNIRDIWANLIANEILTNDVHPDFPNILKRLSSKDAVVLAEIGESNSKDTVKKAIKATVFHLSIMGIAFSSIVAEESDFSREHLHNLGLIKKISGQWSLTLIGEEFLKSVADPTFFSGNCRIK